MLGSKIKLKTGAAIGAGSAGSLKTASAISATLQTVTDTAGNNSALQLSSAAVGFAPGGSSVGSINASGFIIGAGTITQDATVTFKSLGGNIASFRNTSNVRVGYIENNGLAVFASIVSQSGFSIGNGVNNIFSISDGVIRLTDTATTNFTRLIFGSNDTNGVSLVKNTTTIRAMLGNGSALTAFEASQFTSSNLSAGTLTTARPMRFGDRATITEAGFIALGLNRQIAIEHNGVIYYIPVSTTLIP
jgi:hypothetical protein